MAGRSREDGALMCLGWQPCAYQSPAFDDTGECAQCGE
jgi:hypothetical protein